MEKPYLSPSDKLNYSLNIYLKVSDNKYSYIALDPLSPHDAFKHQFTSLKTDLFFLQLGVLETLLPIQGNFL